MHQRQQQAHVEPQVDDVQAVAGESARHFVQQDQAAATTSDLADALLEDIDQMIRDEFVSIEKTDEPVAEASSSEAQASSSDIADADADDDDEYGLLNKISRWWRGGERVDVLGASEPMFGKFALPMADVDEAIRKHLRGVWFAPADFAKDARLGRARPLYVPFWYASCEAVSRFDGQLAGDDRDDADAGGGQWLDHHGVHTFQYVKMLMPALPANHFKGVQGLLARIDDWDAEKATKRRAQLPAGVAAAAAAQTPVDWADVWAAKGLKIRSIERQECEKLLAKAAVRHKKTNGGAGSMRLDAVHTEFRALKHALVYLPIYLSTYSYDDINYPIVINAHSSKVIAERPYGLGGLGKLGKSALSAFDSWIKPK
jgi:hypothetical protein